MIIEEVSYRNMISNPNVVTFSFLNKMPRGDKRLFFEDSIINKPRSEKSKNAILKTIAVIGKNASYKSSSLMAIYKVLSFVTNFKKNAEQHFRSSHNIEEAIEWYETKTGVSHFGNDISIDQIFNKYLNTKIRNEKNNEIKRKYLQRFFNENAFNKEDEIEIKVIFWKPPKAKYTVKVKIFKSQSGEIILRSSVNDEEIDLYNLENKDITTFKYHFASFEHYNIFGERWSSPQNRINLFFHSAIEHLYFENFKSDKNKLIDFLQILDPATRDIKYRAFNAKKRLKLINVQRCVGDGCENIKSSEMSAGTKMFIVYLYFILKYDFLVIDEVEQSLHIKLVALLLEIANEKNKQMIFSTHSPVVIDLLKNYQVYISELDQANGPIIKKANKIFKARDSLLNKYLKDLVSSIPDVDLDFLKMEFYD